MAQYSSGDFGDFRIPPGLGKKIAAIGVCVAKTSSLSRINNLGGWPVAMWRVLKRRVSCLNSSLRL